MSIDSIIADRDDDEFIEQLCIEDLHAQTPGGLPPHVLNLKKYAIVMLLRNMSLQKSLCNGTRLKITEINRYYIECESLANGEITFLPKMPLTSRETNGPFTLQRRQIPVRLAYAMTVNKSQGQTLQKVGVLLREPVFDHGQLYVATSRARRHQDIRFLIKPTYNQGKLGNDVDNCTYTQNIVFKEILQQNPNQLNQPRHRAVINDDFLSNVNNGMPEDIENNEAEFLSQYSNNQLSQNIASLNFN